MVAAFSGNAVNYTIGRVVGPRVFSAADDSGISHKLLNRQHLQRAHSFFEAYGGKAVVPQPLRADRPDISCRSSPARRRCRRPPFGFYNLVGAVAWVLALRRRRTCSSATCRS